MFQTYTIKTLQKELLRHSIAMKIFDLFMRTLTKNSTVSLSLHNPKGNPMVLKEI